jgi:Tol biopolymer transport system component
MKKRIMKLSLIFSALALLCLVPLSRVRATTPGANGRIAFQANTGGGNQIYTVRSNGRELRQITHVDGNAVRPDWSPDGRRIVFAINTPDTQSIAMMNADGSGLVDLITAPDSFFQGVGDPAFTTDGTRIVFEGFDGSEDSVWSVELDGSDRQRITSGPCCGVDDPNVSPDGQTVSFVGYNGLPFGEALFTVGTDGSNLLQLTPFTIDLAIKHDWAPDGQHIVVTTHANFANPGESANIATIRPDGTHLHYLTHYQGGEVNAFVGSYSPDGRWIVFRLEDHGQFGLYKMRPDGTDLQPILGLSSFKPRLIDWGPRARGKRGEDKDDDEDN